MSDRVTSEQMDEGNCEMPGSIVNEMPEENAVDNEMTEDLNNEMPVDDSPNTNAVNIEERHVVNGDSYASRAARTASYEYPPRQGRARVSKNIMPQRPRTYNVLGP